MAGGGEAQRQAHKSRVAPRRTAAVTQTAASRPGTPCTSASNTASPHAHASAGSLQPSPVPLQCPVNPPLQPPLQAMVDAARAALLPEPPTHTPPALGPPQPDYQAQAKEQLAQALGTRVDYSKVKCTARAAAAEAHAVVQSFKRAASATVPPMPTSALPSWHSMEAMEDLSVFAAACAHEVALRAAQIQHDVSEGRGIALSSSGKDAVGSSGALSAAKALQRLSARQAASKRRSAGARAAADAVEEAAEEEIPAAQVPSNADEGRVPPPRKRSRSAGPRARRSAPGPQPQRPPLRDGSNTRAVAMSARAQAAFDRAVERRRGRPADVAFGRRVSGPAAGDEARPRPAASGKSGSAAPAQGDAARSPPLPRPGDHRSTGYDQSAPGQGDMHAGHQYWLAGGGGPSIEGPVHAHSHMRPHVPRHVDCMMEGGSWPVHEMSHMRGAPAHGMATAAANVGEVSSWHVPAGDASQLGGQQYAAAGAVAQPAEVPQPQSSTTDVALVALLQGLTEMIRHNGLSPPQRVPAASALPAPDAGANDDPSRHEGTSGPAAAAEHGNNQLQAHAACADGTARADSQQHGSVQTANLDALPDVGHQPQVQPSFTGQRCTGPVQRFGSMVEAAAWGAHRPPDPQRDFLSVVDLQHPPGGAVRHAPAVSTSLVDAAHTQHISGRDDTRAAEFAALEQLLHSGHRVPGTDFPFPADPERGAVEEAPVVRQVMQDLCAAGVHRAIEAGALQSASAACSSTGASPDKLPGSEAGVPLPLEAAAEWRRELVTDTTRSGEACETSGRGDALADDGVSGGEEVGVGGVGTGDAARRGLLDDIEFAASDLRDSVAVDILHEALEARVQALAVTGGGADGSRAADDAEVSRAASSTDGRCCSSQHQGGARASDYSGAAAAVASARGPGDQVESVEAASHGGESCGGSPPADDEDKESQVTGVDDSRTEQLVGDSAGEDAPWLQDSMTGNVDRGLSGEPPCAPAESARVPWVGALVQCY